MMTCDFKIFTLNCWGIPNISKDRAVRMKAIADYLAQSKYDIVCLQEVWSDKDFILIRDTVLDVLPYAHYFYSGVIGSGICVLSKRPFEEVFYHQWSVNGYAHKLQHADWFGGKGVGYCSVRVHGYKINVYTAHLHAEYNRQCDEYEAHRVLQAFDTAQFIQLTSGDADLVVLAGDLNTEPGDLAYRIIVGVTNFTDSYIEASARDNSLPCNTNETPQNTYTPSSLVKKQFPGKRIDYIMYTSRNKSSEGSWSKCRREVTTCVLNDYRQPLNDKVQPKNCSYSDHEAVTAEIRLRTVDNKDCNVEGVTATVEVPLIDLENVLWEAITVCENALQRLKSHRRIYAFFSVIMLLLMVVTFVAPAPFGWTSMYHVIRIILTAFFCFTLFMATLWNCMESSAVLAGQLSMSVSLERTKEKKNAASAGTIEDI